MYRIVREVNHLTDKVQYVIERRKSFLWMVSWTRDLGLDVVMRGTVGAPSLSGAQWKLDRIKSRDRIMMEREIV
tara:strand:+ start:14842 stop:15063 length:222 start_codon:yes stop_codon:yes gene_type:complete